MIEQTSHLVMSVQFFFYDTFKIFADIVVANPDKCLDHGDDRTRRLTALPDGLTGAYGSQIVNSNNKSDTGNTDKLQHFAYAAKYSAQYGEGAANFLGKDYETVHSLKTDYDQKDIVANELGSEWAQSFINSGESISSFMNRKYIEADGEYKTIDDYFNPNKN